MLAVLRVQHGASAGSEHQIVVLGKLVDHLGLALAESVLALEFEDGGYIHAGAALDFVITVLEFITQGRCQLAADSGLARAHGPDQKNTAGVVHGQ